MGAAGGAGSGQPPPQIDDIVLRGYFVSVDEGSAGERLLIGFGAGAAELRTAVEAYQMTDQGLRQFGRGEIRSGGGKMPGVVVPLAVVAATANPIGLIVGGGSRRPAKRPARPPSKAQADARRTQFRRNCARPPSGKTGSSRVGARGANRVPRVPLNGWRVS